MSDPDEVVLVSSVQWLTRGADSGYHEIDSRKALWMLENLDRHRFMEARDFVAEARLGNFQLYRMDDDEVLKVIRDALHDHSVIAVQKGATKAAAVSETVALRRLVAQLEKQTRGKLSYRGRQYKLVVDIDLANVPGRDGYEVPSQTEAHAVLDNAAKELGAPAEILTKAKEKLSKDWRPPTQPDGLVLLRRIPVRASTPKDTGPALTPSQLKALIEAANREKGPLWVRIEMAPRIAEQENAKFRLTSSDNSIAMTKTVKDDMEPGNETIDLFFEDLWKDLSYSLQVEERGSGAKTLFENVPYADLASFTGQNEDDGADAEYEVADLVDAVRAIGLLDLEDETEA